MTAQIAEEKLEMRILQGILRRTNGENIGGNCIKKNLNIQTIEQA